MAANSADIYLPAGIEPTPMSEADSQEKQQKIPVVTSFSARPCPWQYNGGFNSLLSSNESGSLHHRVSKLCVKDKFTVETNQSNVVTKTTEMFPYCGNACLPVSMGCIKKMAHTRFVNSSPRSYRLMPASVESSDMTSFVEKSSHNHVFPRFFLDVAELWKLSKRSELECNFTLAKSERISGSDECINEARHKSPICHTSVVPARTRRSRKIRRLKEEESVNFSEEISSAALGRDLLADVKRFFRSQKLKECHPMGIAGFMKPDLQQTQQFHGRHNHSSMEKQFDSRYQHSLTPLVKRLSVSGLAETIKNNKNKILQSESQSYIDPTLFVVGHSNSPPKRAQASAKRPSSNRKLDHGDEPLQKRANFVNKEGNILSLVSEKDDQPD